jgi:hypothetical protein
MEKEDAMYQILERLHERRKQVVRPHVKGIKIMQIVALSGLTYPTVKLKTRRIARRNAQPRS